MNISRRVLLFNSIMTAGCGTLGKGNNGPVKPNTLKGEETRRFLEGYPVGRVKREAKSVHLHIFERYADALKGLDGFSHVFVLYWFDRNDTPEKRSILQVHPRGNKRNPLTGVFACRAPVRPNLIALSLCRIISVKGDKVHIDKIDALNNSPILDLKPYIPQIDCISEGVRVPDWLRE